MGRVQWLAVFGLAALSAASPAAHAQPRPYIGYVYPAGGRQGTTFQIRLGGQNLDDVDGVLISGTGVRAKVTEYLKRLGNQEMTLLREQLTELRKGPQGAAAKDEATQKLIARIDRRMAEYVQNPANASISSLVFVEVTMAPDAAPGRRELRLATPRGVTNPLVFHVGQLPEFSRKPMTTSSLQILGKEESSLRKRPPEEEEANITVPCTANGQIASGEVNRYRFEARKGQRLLISVDARLLNPYIADAVPGWFQPVLMLCDAGGKELAYCDDYRFKPDPVIFFEVPQDGKYVLNVTDAIYRGREDFVYRLTIGELPFVTSIFPLGGRAGEPAKIEMKGWDLTKAVLTPPPKDAGPGIHPVAASKDGFTSNRLPFALDTLPEGFDKESNNDRSSAQKVKLPIVINGRIDRPDDWDVFEFAGRAGDTVVAEVIARRLDSPLDSVLKLTDANGSVLAMNDDHEDVEAGVNTHDADSHLMFKLPADGTYYVHLGDAARSGGPEYAYRLRLSEPRPDFALFVVPSSIALRGKATASVSVQALRKDGFTGPISVGLKNPPAGFSLTAGSIQQNQTAARLTLTTSLTATTQPVSLCFEGRAKIQQRDVAHEALAAEDRMQAFLWRHLVPAQDLKVLVYDPSYTPPPKRVRRTPATAPAATKPATAPAGTKPATPAAGKLKFTKQEVAGRLRQIKFLFEEGLLTDDFCDRKTAECEAAQ